MFKSRENGTEWASEIGMSGEVTVPLVKTQDGKEFDRKHKSSSQTIISSSEQEQEEAVQAQESKRRKRRVMKVAVYFMFGVIALGVFAIWLFHKDSVESMSFGSDFVFTVKLRSLEIKNKNGDSVLYGDMGRNLLATPYDYCWDSTYTSYDESCLYWRDMARLRVSRDDNSTTSCYTFQWESMEPEFQAEDCFYLQRYSWYGYLLNTTPVWPIIGVSIEQKDYYTEYPVEQTEHLVPMWFGSQGVSIFVDPSYPFLTSWNITDKCQFCIISKMRSQVKLEPLTVLRYTVCQGISIKDVYNISRQHRQDVDIDFVSKQKQKYFIPSEPIRVLTKRGDLLEVLDQMKRNESKCSFVELYDDWEGEFGNLSVHRTMKESVQALIDEAYHQGCYPVLPISTFFSYKSQHYREGVKNGYFVRDSQNLVTRMIKWRNQEGAVLDVTNPEAERWFLSHIQMLVQEFGVKALRLLHVTLPPASRYYDNNMTYLDYTRVFYKSMAALNISLIVELTTGFIPSPVYLPVQMKFFERSSSRCLNTSIPYSLMMGMSGFPLLIASFDKTVLNSTTEDMFKLWLQMAIFFPVLEIPSIHFLESKEMQDFLQESLSFRSRELLPYLTKVWDNEPGLPVVRPMWWNTANDQKAQIIDDQFMVGDKLLVAPVLCEGNDKRHVYLPEGTWYGHGMKPVLGPKIVEIFIKNFTVFPYFWTENRIWSE